MKTDKNKLAQVLHFDLYGMREEKYKFLDDNSMASIPWKALEPKEPYFYLTNKTFTNEDEYESGFHLTELFKLKSSGIKTHDDNNFVSDNRLQLQENVIELNHEFENSKVFKYAYRPFDIEFIYYDTNLLGRAREKTIYHLKNENIALILVAQAQAANLNYFDSVFISNYLTDTNMFRRGGPSCFPLYLYPKIETTQTTQPFPKRTPNLNREIINQIAEKLGLRFTNEKEEDILENASPVCYATSDEVMEEFVLADPPQTFAPIDILDYIYAVLYSPAYREKYKEFLKIDFPRVPYPKNQFSFWKLVKLGGELRQIHLLECTVVEKSITTYPVDGNDVVGKVIYESGRVYINRRASSSPSVIERLQYFENVPQVAWDFYIGGYQPAQKWLKDRKGRELTSDDISHYQKIIVALTETGRIMKEIDKIKME